MKEETPRSFRKIYKKSPLGFLFFIKIEGFSGALPEKPSFTLTSYLLPLSS